MKSTVLREVLLYRYRYIIGYILFVVLLVALLLTDISSVPGGISLGEMESSIASNSLNPLAPLASDVINLPYHLLQKLSIGLFGLSPLSIRLPSLVLAFGASIVLAIMLNQWFRKGTATLTLLLAITSVPFLTMGRVGTAGVLYMLLLLIIMLGAAKLTTRSTGTFVWKLVIASAGLLLFYMPLGIYAVIALLIAGVIHPHVRYQIKRTRLWQYLVLFTAAGILLTPLILAGLNDMSTVRVLFGLDALRDRFTLTNLGVSLMSIFKTLFLFHKPSVGEVVTPFLNLTFMLLIAFGLVRTILDRHSARAYLLLIWLGISVPLLIINPNQFALLFVPCLILMAVGLETFMREWYQLFPRNPYARIGGLFPVMLLTLGMVSIAASRYFYSYYYTDTTQVYRPELSAVRQVINPHVRTQLIVPTEEVAFYDILRSKHDKLTVASPETASSDVAEQIVLARSGQSAEQPADKIVTSHFSQNNVLLRVYK